MTIFNYVLHDIRVSENVMWNNIFLFNYVLYVFVICLEKSVRFLIS